MFWGCIGWVGVGSLVEVNNNLDSDGYINILFKYLIPWMNNHSYTTFQQDGASCHTSHYSRWWMQTHSIPVLEWTAQSPDLNPIEHICDYLDRQIRKRELLPTSRKDLIDMLKEEWQKVPLDVVRNLISSMPRRIAAVIKAKEAHTHY